MKWNELIDLLKDNGYVFVKHGKKHDQYRNPATGDIQMVERHGSQEVRPGLLNSIKKRAGLK
ncbi:MAG: type II toxin-antitoxin system HicA family toxin [Muribaculaceae bacterium]|nr:type II toxin-antitoxin system HicA family toxin [Muribaculaceae bacterium]